MRLTILLATLSFFVVGCANFGEKDSQNSDAFLNNSIKTSAYIGEEAVDVNLLATSRVEKTAKEDKTLYTYFYTLENKGPTTLYVYSGKAEVWEAVPRCLRFFEGMTLTPGEVYSYRISETKVAPVHTDVFINVAVGDSDAVIPKRRVLAAGGVLELLAPCDL